MLLFQSTLQQSTTNSLSTGRLSRPDRLTPTGGKCGPGGPIAGPDLAPDGRQLSASKDFCHALDVLIALLALLAKRRCAVHIPCQSRVHTLEAPGTIARGLMRSRLHDLPRPIANHRVPLRFSLSTTKKVAQGCVLHVGSASDFWATAKDTHP